MPTSPLPSRARRRHLLAVPALLAALVAPLLVGRSVTAVAEPAPGSLWLTDAELAALPTSGSAWTSLVEDVDGDWGAADVADQSSEHDTTVFAAALVAERTGDAALRRRVTDALADVPGTEAGGRTLALGRNLVGYVLAADLIGYRDPAFVRWVDAVRSRDLDGRTLVSTHEDRPNNWGTHAGASRIAAALYLGDTDDLQRAADVFAGWLGDRSRYASFEYDDDLSWQCDPRRPVGINPAGCTIDGRDVDGVIADDQRRGGSFSWPPPAENYVWEALQGAVVQAHLLHRAGFPAWSWSDAAIVRSLRWLHDHADYPAEGDDTWTPWLVNHATGSSFPAPDPSRPGKNIGYTDWSHARRATGSGGFAAPPAPRVDLTVSQARFDDGAARHAVLGRNDLFVDSLAGSVLTNRGPLLFTPTDRLDGATASELDRVLPDGGTVFLLGGRDALAPAVQRAVEALGLRTRRLAGEDRVATALAIANVAVRRSDGSTVAVARAAGPSSDPASSAAWVDAATAGAWAAATGHPIVVTPTESLDPRVARWLEAAAPASTVLLGGPDALGDPVGRALGDAVRVAGPTRADTAARIVSALWGSDRRADHFTVVDGWADDGWRAALVAAGLAADEDAPLLLLDPSTDVQPAATLRTTRMCDGADVTLHAVGMSRSRATDLLRGGC